MLPRTRTQRLPVHRFPAGPAHDEVALEEPLELHLSAPDGQRLRLATLLRTPGHDFELALGFLYNEGVIQSAQDVRSISYCNAPQDYNVLSIEMRQPLAPEVLQAFRPFAVNSSCGACGRGMVETGAGDPLHCPPVDRAWLESLPDQLRLAQPLFAATGGVHGAALVDLGGSLRMAYEDVGRHNAVDKITGKLLQDGALPASHSLLLLSGRIGYELVQKAIRCRIPAVAALGAPTSLAVRLARQSGLLLVGFLAPGRLNVYHGSLS